jgi:hypothetical protein
MEKYIRKPVEVEAEQYFNGKEMEEVFIIYPIIFTMTDSNAKKYFYISNCDAKKWLSIEKQEDGKRVSYPFDHWYGNCTETIHFDIDNPLVQMYLEEFNLDWPIPHAYLKESAININNSDWIVKEDGRIRVYSNENFEKKFKKQDSHVEFYDQMYKCLAEDREAFSAEFRKDNL